MLGGSFILMINKPTMQVLLGLRSLDAEWNPNTWCPFGGTIQEGEDPMYTAIREYFEETRISRSDYFMSSEPIYIKKTKDNSGQIHQMFLYLGIVQTGIQPTINNEHQGFMWCDISNLYKFNVHPILVDVFNDSDSLKVVTNLLLNQ